MSDTTQAAPGELAAGAEVPAGADAAGSGPPRSGRIAAPEHPTARRRHWRLWVLGAVLVGAFAFLLAEGLGGSLNYFETVDQAIAHKASLGTRTVRLEGVVVPGTVHRNGDVVSFVAAGAHHRVAVVNHGVPPQLFQPDIPVVVVGHFTGDTFVSNQLIVDHTAQYIEQHPARIKAPNGSVR